MLAILGGTGPEGKGLALRLAMAGETPIIGSRDASRGAAVAEELAQSAPGTTIKGMDNSGAAQSADVVIIVGTSAQVFPAAQLPLTAKERGATIIEVNIERTDFTDTITDHFLQGKAGEVLPRLAAEVMSE